MDSDTLILPTTNSEDGVSSNLPSEFNRGSEGFNSNKSTSTTSQHSSMQPPKNILIQRTFATMQANKDANHDNNKDRGTMETSNRPFMNTLQISHLGGTPSPFTNHSNIVAQGVMRYSELPDNSLPYTEDLDEDRMQDRQHQWETLMRSLQPFGNPRIERIRSTEDFLVYRSPKGICESCPKNSRYVTSPGTEVKSVKCRMIASCFTVFSILGASEIANLLRGVVQDMDCEAFLTCLFIVEHWNEAFHHMEATWQNGLTMTLLYCYALGIAYSDDTSSGQSPINAQPSFGSAYDQLSMFLHGLVAETITKERNLNLRNSIKRFIHSEEVDSNFSDEVIYESDVSNAIDRLARDLLLIDFPPESVITPTGFRQMSRVMHTSVLARSQGRDPDHKHNLWEGIRSFLKGTTGRSMTQDLEKAAKDRKMELRPLIESFNIRSTVPLATSSNHSPTDSPKTSFDIRQRPMLMFHSSSSKSFTLDQQSTSFHGHSYFLLETIRRATHFADTRRIPLILAPHQKDRQTRYETLRFLELFTNIFGLGTVVYIGGGDTWNQESQIAYDIRLACSTAHRSLGRPFIILLPYESLQLISIPGATPKQTPTPTPTQNSHSANDYTEAKEKKE